MLHDFFFKVFLAERALGLHLQPFESTLLVEVVPGIAVEHHNGLRLPELLLANDTFLAGNKLIVISVLDLKQT